MFGIYSLGMTTVSASSYHAPLSRDHSLIKANYMLPAAEADELFDKTLEYVRKERPEVLDLKASRGEQIATLLPIFCIHDKRLGPAIRNVSIDEFIDMAMALVLTDGRALLTLLRYCSKDQFNVLSSIGNFYSALRNLKFDEIDVEAFLNHCESYLKEWIYKSPAFAPEDTIEVIVKRVNTYDIQRINQISPLALVVCVKKEELAAISCYLEKDQVTFIARHAAFTHTLAVKESLVKHESPLIETLLESLEHNNNFIHLHPKHTLEDELKEFQKKMEELVPKVEKIWNEKSNDLILKEAFKLHDSMYHKACYNLFKARLPKKNLIIFERFNHAIAQLRTNP